MFNELKGDGRVWIYTANRQLSPGEQSEISAKLKSFCSEWSAHGSSLKSDFNIFNNQFMVLAVDEHFEAASGCSIDSSVEVFKSIDLEYQLDLFNRMNLGFLIEDEVKIIKLSELSAAYEGGQITGDTLFIDNTISSLRQLREEWHKPLSQSWAATKIKQLA